MVKINFIPDDYIRSREAYRINIMYLALLAVVIGALGLAFTTIKIRQRMMACEEEFVKSKMVGVQEDIKKYEEFDLRQKELMKTAMMTSDLLELAPRSILLALLTNNLPAGVSFLELNVIQRTRTASAAVSGKASDYEIAQTKKAEAVQKQISQEPSSETFVSIGGIAPSDVQITTYIERLGKSKLLDNIVLVESKEYDVSPASTSDSMTGGDREDRKKVRQFKLTAILKKDVHLTAEDISRSKTGL